MGVNGVASLSLVRRLESLNPTIRDLSPNPSLNSYTVRRHDYPRCGFPHRNIHPDNSMLSISTARAGCLPPGPSPAAYLRHRTQGPEPWPSQCSRSPSWGAPLATLDLATTEKQSDSYKSLLECCWLRLPRYSP